MYISKKMQVKPGEILSNQFIVGTGIKQGGDMSLGLFTVYLVNVLNTL